jgi:broad specificity phosphatase PhoE
MSIFTRFFVKKKIVYFARHGESENNAKGLRQGAEGGLSERGREQAAFLGERFRNSNIEAIIASPYERTQETAKAISAGLKTPLAVETSHLLAERRNPSDIIGRPADDPEVSKIVDMVDRSFHEDDFRHLDEENFSDLKLRARELLEWIDRRPEHHLVLVTHRIFLKFVVSYIERGENFHAHDFAKLDYLNTVHPAAVTICEYDPREGDKENQGWKMLVWDDYERNIEENEEAGQIKAQA